MLWSQHAALGVRYGRRSLGEQAGTAYRRSNLIVYHGDGSIDADCAGRHGDRPARNLLRAAGQPLANFAMVMLTAALTRCWSIALKICAEAHPRVLPCFTCLLAALFSDLDQTLFVHRVR